MFKANQNISQIFEAANRFSRIIWYKWENLIKNQIFQVDKIINTNKKQIITADKHQRLQIIKL